MSEAAPPAPARDEPGPPQDRLAALRSQGAWRMDPARFHYLEGLARRLPDQPEPVRRLLWLKLDAGLADYAERAAQARPSVADASTRPAAGADANVDTGCAAATLAGLNHYIRSALRQASEPPAASVLGEPQQADELQSVRRFRRAWSSGRAQDQVAGAAARQPAGAGPLNSHRLVLQSLALMGELSPDYLQRFLMQVESLQWLARAADKYPDKQAATGKPAKPARRRNTRK